MTPEIEKRIKAVRAGRVPAGYKKSKVGIVPRDWDVYDLRSISIELHESAGKEIYEPLSISAGIGFVNQTNKFGKDISGAQYAKYTVLKKGDFSYNKGNSKKYPQGCVYQLKDRDEAVVPNVFESFRLTNGENDFFEQLFINGFLNSQLFSKINHGVRDDGLLNLRGDDFYSCQVPFPPIVEQKKIAEILATQDRVIELKEKLIAEKQNQKKYLMSVLLGDDFKKPFKLNGITIDKKKWEKKELGEICEKIGSGSTPKGGRAVYLESGVPIIRSQNVLNGFLDMNDVAYISEEQHKKMRGTWVCADDILLNITGASIGRACIVPDYVKKANVNQHVCIIRLKENMQSYFLCNIILSDKIQEQIKLLSAGGGRQGLNFQQISSFQIALPTLPEQKVIADVLSAADEEISLLQKDLEQEKLKKKSLMQLLLTGLVRVQ